MAKIIQPRYRSPDSRRQTRPNEEESWWRDEVGIVVEHEVWHLPRLAEEQTQN